jgi:hypothetical protein
MVVRKGGDDGFGGLAHLILLSLAALAILAVALLSTAACVETKDYGRGRCVEYKPLLCVRGGMCCTTVEKGCRQCTCTEASTCPPGHGPN